MNPDAREHYALWSQGQRRIFRAATLAYIRDCEALAKDERAALMRSWGIPQMTAPIRYCDDCNKPIEQCDCLPFADPREVTE